MEDNDKLNYVITIEEMADILKISKSTAYQLSRTKGFPTLKLGKRRLILFDELKVWLKENCSG